MTSKRDVERLRQLSDEGILKWQETLQKMGSTSSFHYGTEAERVASDWRPRLEDVEEEISRRGIK